jgi:hypothetical protein
MKGASQKVANDFTPKKSVVWWWESSFRIMYNESEKYRISHPSE